MQKVLIFLLLSVVLVSGLELKRVSNSSDKFLVVTTDSEAAKRINSFLAGEFSIRVENSKLISENDLLQTIDEADLHKNNPLLLSLFFDIEYDKRVYSKYYSFNAKSGLEINLRELFSRDGYEEFKKFMKKAKIDEIDKTVLELEKGDSKSKKRFEECKSNEITPEDSFLVKEDQLVVSLGDCLPSIDYFKDVAVNYDVKISDIKEYLNEYGKKILFSRGDDLKKLEVLTSTDKVEIKKIKKEVVQKEVVKSFKEYLTEFNFAKALEIYKQKKGLKPLLYNPFNAYTSSKNNKKKTKSKKTMVDFLETFIKIQNILKEDESKVMDNYLLANAYYNLSSYGNLSVNEKDKAYNKKLINLSKKHYKKAFDGVKKRKFKAKIGKFIKRVESIKIK